MAYRAVTKKTFPLSKVYGLLEPGPVVLVTTKSGPAAAWSRPPVIVQVPLAPAASPERLW